MNASQADTMNGAMGVPGDTNGTAHNTADAARDSAAAAVSVERSTSAIVSRLGLVALCPQQVENGLWNAAVVRRVSAAMTHDKLYNEETEVTARDGEVILDGPDGVDVKVTPEAAERTADNLIDGAVKARGQRRLLRLPHKAQ
jgi:hypothetical protein